MAPNIPTRTLRDYVNSFPRVDDAQLVISPDLTVGSSPISIDGVDAGTAININQSNPQRPSVSLDIASQAEAEAGVSNVKGMTPLGTKQHVDNRIAEEADAEGGMGEGLMTSELTRAAIDTRMDRVVETYADANNILSDLTENQTVIVLNDETKSGAQVWYRVEGGALVEKLNERQRTFDLFSNYPRNIWLVSSPDGGVTADTTRRINLDSWQKPVAGNNAAGEVFRIWNRAPDAKSMFAVYQTQNLQAPYDPETNPMRSVASVWHGAHWAAQDDINEIHGHWSIETPDVSQSLRTRFAVDFASWDENDVISHGGSRIAIYTNKADLTINASSDDTNDPNLLRVAGTVSYDRLIEFSNSVIGRGSQRTSGRRWQLGSVKGAEGSGSTGSDFVIRRFSNNGTSLGTALFMSRDEGKASFGLGTNKTLMNGGVNSGFGSDRHGFYARRTNSGGSFANFQADLNAVGDRAYQSSIIGETGNRFRINADGRMYWGNGTDSPDVSMYREATTPARIRMENDFTLSGTLRLVGPTGFVQLPMLASFLDGASSQTARLAVVDNGSGKMQLVVRFPSGGAQILATEP